ncbi:hypothetical protein IWW50_003595 [Coemansia erecta]|nr:hypothetical protein GGF43_003569 [Coemansia sp. RSA 2618]KAJ2823876.1 hypothetical protein IWW50_003595 [Coemansia erecta]
MLTSLALATAFNLAVATPAALTAASSSAFIARSGASEDAAPPVSDTQSTVFTRDAASTKRQLDEIYCPTRDCKGGRDWLTMQPNAAAGWAVGSIALLCSGFLIRLRPSFTCAAMLDLAISLYLRAGLNYEHGNKRAMYIASLFFHYNCATIIFVNVMNGAFSLKAAFDESKVGRAVASSLWALLLNMALFAMVVAGVVVMFRKETLVEVNAGWRLIQAVLYIIVIMMGLSMLVLLKNSCGGSGGQTLVSLVVLLAVVLMGLWASFMLARTYVPLTNVARSSEVAWYLLGVMPLLLIGIIF